MGIRTLSLRTRTMLLASFGIGAMLVGEAALRLHFELDDGRKGLTARATLLATIQADALSVPLWNFDDDMLAAGLDALMRDPDFASAVILKPDGTPIRERGAPDLAGRAEMGSVEVTRPIRYVDHGDARTLGELRLSLRTDHLGAMLVRHIWQRALMSLLLLLGPVLLILHFTIVQLSGPLDRLASALTRLAAGEQDVDIPARHRTDEVGAVARGLQVFKDTAFQLARMRDEYRAVFDHAALGIYCLDAEGRLVSANPALLALTRSRDVASLRARVEAMGPDSLFVDPHRVGQLIGLRETQDGYHGELCQMRRADGSTGWTMESVRPVRDACGRKLGYVGTVEDVTETHRRTAEERMRIRAAVESAGDAILIMDADGTPLFVNRAFAAVLGYDIAGLLESGGIKPLLRDDAAGRRVALALTGSACRVETDLVARTGRLIPMAVSVGPIEGESGEVVGSILICTDQSDRRAAEAQIDHMAHHDSLTGLPNRVALGLRLRAALDAGSELAVLWVDLDRFKEVNETLGHAVGDGVLQQAAARLAAVLDEGDLVARAGADEFVVIRRRAAQADEAATLAARLIAELSRPYSLGGSDVLIGASAGVALAPQDSRDADDLLRFAALALYEAKISGRGTAWRFSPEMDRALHLRSSLERDLRRAIAEAALEVHFQPQCRLLTGEVVGAEALLRWSHPERGAVSPAEFIPLAEETGLIGPLGEWVLNTACREAAGWSRKLRVAVNISPAQFRTGDLVGQVRTALACSGLAADRLELEITEGVMLHDTETTLSILHAIKALGVRLAMDDFGTGYSSLSYLRRMPIDKIKIDQSFVRALGREPAAAALVRSIIGIGRGLGIEANAEGVETEEQARLLRQEGCDEVQGWHYGRPCAAALFAAGLQEARPRAA